MRSLYLLVLSLFSLGMYAQECLPTSFVLSTSIENNGTLFMEWTLSEAGGQSISAGGNLFNAEVSSVPFSGCLFPGCYQLVAVADGMIPPISTFLSVEVSNGFVNEYDYTVVGNTYTVDFCVVENSDCVLDVTVAESPDCNVINLVANNFNPNAQLTWIVNGQPVVASVGLSYEATEPGDYEICVGYETPDCPEGVFWCETFTVTSGCIEGIDCGLSLATQQADCGNFSVVATVPSGWQNVSWTLNGEPLDGLVWNQEFDLPDGEYVICASFESPACGFVSECITVVVDCNPNPCLLEYTLTQTGCGEYTAEVTQAPEGLDVYLFWLGDVILVEDGTATFTVDVTEVYEVCLFIESNECPDGVFECVEQEFFGCECPDALSTTVDGCVGQFVLDGILAGAGAEFFVNGVFVGDDTNWEFAYDFPTNGVYEVCAVSNNPACANFPLCTEVEITDCVSCTEVFIEVTANPSAIEEALILQALLEGIALDTEIEVLFFELEASLGIGVCLPDGCYELNAELPGIPSLDIAVTVGDEVVLEHSFSPANPNVSLEFGINDPDCGSGIGEYTATSIRAYPVPAAQNVTLEWPFNGQTAIAVYDMTGRVVVAQQTVVSGRFVLDVSGFADGVYLVQAAGEFGLYSGRIQVSR
ncbi:MAG: T9SS type A sorting domain-containing protein [Flavobacteriales bacterium]